MASAGDINALRSIVASDPSLLESPRSPRSAFSVMLYFLPEAIEFHDYADLLHKMITGDFDESGNTPDVDIGKLSDELLDQRTSKIADYIASKTETYGWTASDDTKFIDDWIKARIRLVDAATGLISDPMPLFSSTESPDSDLLAWQFGIVQVISSYRSLYYTQSEWISLCDFEKLTPRLAVQLLLQFTSVETVVRDINTLVVPYLTYKCAETNDYSALWEWMGQTTNVYDEDPPAHLLLLVQLVEAGGISLPTETANFKFIRAVLAYIYAYPSSHYTAKTYLHFSEVQKDLGDFELDTESPNYEIPNDIVETDLYSFNTLITSNLTSPTLYSLGLLDKFVSSGALLATHIPNISLIEVAVTSLFGTEEDQIALARLYIFNQEDQWKTLDAAHWGRIRDNLRWLKTKSQVLAKVPDSWIDETLLVSTLSCGRFDFVRSHFVDVRRTAVPTNVLTKHLLDAFYENYDLATNCSTSRGMLKNAAACLALLEEKHSKKHLPSALTRASRLLSATNELSTYSLTLNPDTPLHPVELRVQTKDPLSIIHRILELNPKAYKDLAKLQVIGADLVYGILGKDLPNTDLKVRAMCIDGALVDSNFEQAYKYTDALREAPATQDEESRQLIWTTCYQVGKFVSPYWDDTDVKFITSVLEKQLDLLGFTLATAPNENLSSILSAWQRIEAQLADIERTADAVPEPQQQHHHHHQDILKSTTSRFARAIQSSAAATFSSSDTSSVSSDRTGHSSTPSEELHNSRKRDQISGLLVSGLGWAIGANPR